MYEKLCIPTPRYGFNKQKTSQSTWISVFGLTLTLDRYVGTFFLPVVYEDMPTGGARALSTCLKLKLSLKNRL